MSILLPVHNGQAFIAEAIQSVIRQTASSWELIVIDDASTDSSLRIARRFKHRQIRVHCNPKQAGISRSLNIGIRLARGALLARLDADDIAEPNRIAVQLEFLRSNKDHGLVGSWMTVFGEESFMARYPGDDPAIRLEMLFQNPFGHPSVMFRKDWDNGSPGWYDERLAAAQDYDLWERISRQWKCANIEQPLTRYRVHSQQVTKTNHLARRAVEQSVRSRQHESLGLGPLHQQKTFIAEQVWWLNLAKISLHLNRYPTKLIFTYWARFLRRSARGRILTGLQSVLTQGAPR